MDLIYTESNFADAGILFNYSLDLDLTDKMDFQIDIGIDEKQPIPKGIWYINGTEYGGIIDTIEVMTNSNSIRYTGRNFRGILNSKIVIPPEGQAYLTLQGNVTTNILKLLQDYGVSEMFNIIENEDTFSGTFQVNRYITLYETLNAMAYSVGKIIRLMVYNRKVYIQLAPRIDYSQESEYRTGEMNFDVTKGYSPVNHLILLGQGELTERQVYNLYVNADKQITETQYYFGLDENTDIYENTNAESLDDLISEGKKRLSELINTDKFEITLNTDRYSIGDVIQCYEPITGYRVKREITNMIIKIDDGILNIDYTVGGESVSGAVLPAPEVETYVLPIATRTTLGGIKVGTSLDIVNGKLNAIRVIQAILDSPEYQYLQHV